MRLTGLHLSYPISIVFFLLASILFIGAAQATYLQVQNGSTIQASNSTVYTTTSDSFVNVSTLPSTQNIFGNFNVSFDYRSATASNLAFFRLTKNGIVQTTGITSNSATWVTQTSPNIISNSTDIWIVQAYSSGGNDQPEVRNFNLTGNYSTITITSPVNNSAQTSQTVNVTWTGTAPYQYQVSSTGDFSTLLFNATTANNYSGNLTFPIGLNYIRVKGYNTTANSETNWSNIFNVYSQYLEFVSPTPENNSNIAVQYINVSSLFAVGSDLTSAYYIFNGTNKTIFNSSTLLYFNFNNISALGETATTVKDISIYNANGALTNAVINNSGKYGSAVQFDGAGDFIYVDTKPEPVSAITIEAYLYLTSTSGTQIMIDKMTGGAYYGYEFWLSSGKVCLDLYASTEKSVCGLTTLSPNTWYHVSGVYNGTNQSVWVNGLLDGSIAQTGSINHTNSPQLYFGSRTGGGSYYLSGLLDNVRISGYAKTASDFTYEQRFNLTKINSYVYNFLINETSIASYEVDNTISMNVVTSAGSMNITRYISYSPSISNVQNYYFVRTDSSNPTLSIDANILNSGVGQTFSDNSSDWDINSVTGVVSWTPGLSDVGRHIWKIDLLNSSSSVMDSKTFVVWVLNNTFNVGRQYVSLINFSTPTPIDNYQVRLDLDVSDTDWNRFDLTTGFIFTDLNGTTVYPYFVGDFDDKNNITIFVNISASGTEGILWHYGYFEDDTYKYKLGSGNDNGTAVFDRYDGFDNYSMYDAIKVWNFSTLITSTPITSVGYEVWRWLYDVNGDGRTDIVIAANQSRWFVAVDQNGTIIYNSTINTTVQSKWIYIPKMYNNIGYYGTRELPAIVTAFYLNNGSALWNYTWTNSSGIKSMELKDDGLLVGGYGGLTLLNYYTGSIIWNKAILNGVNEQGLYSGDIDSDGFDEIAYSNINVVDPDATNNLTVIDHDGIQNLFNISTTVNHFDTAQITNFNYSSIGNEIVTITDNDNSSGSMEGDEISVYNSSGFLLNSKTLQPGVQMRVADIRTDIDGMEVAYAIESEVGNGHVGLLANNMSVLWDRIITDGSLINLGDINGDGKIEILVNECETYLCDVFAYSNTGTVLGRWNDMGWDITQSGLYHTGEATVFTDSTGDSKADFTTSSVPYSGSDSWEEIGYLNGTVINYNVNILNAGWTDSSWNIQNIISKQDEYSANASSLSTTDKYFNTVTDTNIIGFWINDSNVYSTATPIIYTGESVTNLKQASLIQVADGYIQAFDGDRIGSGNWISLVNVSNNTWTNIEIINNFNAHYYDVSINGTIYNNSGLHYGFRGTPDSFQWIRLLHNDDSYLFYVDGIYSRKYTSTNIVNTYSFLGASGEATTPPSPIGLTYIKSTNFVNYTWTDAQSNGIMIDNYNVSMNGVWNNSSLNKYFNYSGPQNYANIIVYSYNTSGNGNISLNYVTANITFSDVLTTEINVYTTGWQYTLVNDTMTTSQFNALHGVSWLSYWNATSQAFETYKAGWSYHNTLSMAKGSGVAARFSTNKSLTMTMNDSYSWNLSIGYNLIGIEVTKTLAQINTSVNIGCEADKITYTDPQTQVQYIFTCGQAGNATQSIPAGTAIWMNATSAISKERVWV